MSMQVIVMTSDNQYHCLNAYCHLFEKYYGMSQVHTVFCGFSLLPKRLQYPEYEFYSIGKYEDYPPDKWSDALIKVLDNVADDVFMLMLGDYWLVRPTDTYAIKMMHDYMGQFKYVLKFDLTTERLFADGGGKYLFGYNSYDTLGYLDLIKSSFGSPYHLSLWGGLWRRDLLREFIIPDETAQQIELNGTHRLAQKGDDVLVLGTRQAPMRHANVIQGGRWNQDAMVGLPALTENDREHLKELGYL
jgi:hypothetical protein